MTIPAAMRRYVAQLEAENRAMRAARWAGAAGDGTCGVPWPPSLNDVAPIHCDRDADHLTMGVRHGGRTGWAPGHDLEWDD